LVKNFEIQYLFVVSWNATTQSPCPLVWKEHSHHTKNTQPRGHTIPEIASYKQTKQTTSFTV